MSAVRGQSGGRPPRPAALDIPQDPEARLNTVVDLLQQKYEENLNVINTIYNEKREMELKVKALEQMLKEKNVEHGLSPSRGDEDTPETDSDAFNTRRSDTRDRYSSPTTAGNYYGRRPTSAGNYRQGGDNQNRLSASDVAATFDRENHRFTGGNNVNYEGSRPSSKGLDTHSMEFDRRPRSANRYSNTNNRLSTTSLSSAGEPGRRARSLSAGTYAYGRGISAELHASQNRYVQTVMLSRLQEEAERQKQLEYEKYLRERLARAAKHKEFKSLSVNEKLFQEKKEKKLREKQRQQEEMKRLEILSRKQKIKEHINKPRDELYTGLNWQQLEEKLNNERTARLQQRREMLKKEMKPFALHQSVRSKDEMLNNNATATGSATNEVVTKRVVSATLCNEERKKRDEECLKRKQMREQREREKAEKELREKMEEERRKKEIIDNMTLPASSRRLTRAAEDRARAVRAQIEKERQEEKERQKAEEEKKRREREHAAAIQQMIKLNDEDRKSRTNFTELSSAIQKAEQGQKEYKEKLLENRQILNEKLKERPSLMQRHDKAIAINAATNSAIAKVGSVISSVHRNNSVSSNSRNSASKKGGGNNKYTAKDEYDEDEDFNEILGGKEKLIYKAVKAEK